MAQETRMVEQAVGAVKAIMAQYITKSALVAEIVYNYIKVWIS